MNIFEEIKRISQQKDVGRFLIFYYSFFKFRAS